MNLNLTTSPMHSLPVVDYLHCAVLLDPEFAQDDIVDTAVRVSPCVSLMVPGGEETRGREVKSRRDEGKGRIEKKKMT